MLETLVGEIPLVILILGKVGALLGVLLFAISARVFTLAEEHWRGVGWAAASPQAAWPFAVVTLGAGLRAAMANIVMAAGWARDAAKTGAVVADKVVAFAAFLHVFFLSAVVAEQNVGIFKLLAVELVGELAHRLLQLALFPDQLQCVLLQSPTQQHSQSLGSCIHGS